MSASWTCAMCSTSNGEDDPRCVVCATARPAVGLPSPPGSQQQDATVVVPTEPLVPVVERQQEQRPPPPVSLPVGAATRSLAYADARPSHGPPPSSGRSAAIIAAFVVVALAVGVVAFLVVSGMGDDTKRSANTADEADVDYDESARQDPDERYQPEEEAAVVATTMTTVSPMVERQAGLWAGVAKLRTRPSLDAGEVHKFNDAKGEPIAILGPMTSNGWYEVEIDGYQGYLYAGLVVPPEPGYCVIEGPDYWVEWLGSSRILLRLDAEERGTANDASAEVIPPNGGYEWVDWDEIKTSECSGVD